MLIKSTITGEIVNLASAHFIGIESAVNADYEVFGFFGNEKNRGCMDIRLYAGSLQGCMGYKGWLEKQLLNVGVLLPEYEPPSEDTPDAEPPDGGGGALEESYNRCSAPNNSKLNGGGGALEESYKVFPVDVAAGISYLLGEVRQFCWDGQTGAVRFGVQQKEKTVDEIDEHIKKLLSEKETLELIQWQQCMRNVFFSLDDVRLYVMGVLGREDTRMAYLPQAGIIEICYQFAMSVPVANIANTLGHSQERLLAVAEEYGGFVRRLREAEGNAIEKYRRRIELWEEWNDDNDIPF